MSRKTPKQTGAATLSSKAANRRIQPVKPEAWGSKARGARILCFLLMAATLAVSGQDMRNRIEFLTAWGSQERT